MGPSCCLVVSFVCERECVCECVCVCLMTMMIPSGREGIS